MNHLILSSAPHMSKNHSTRRIMIDVLIALTPVALAAIYFFGYMVAVNLFFCIVFCAGFELLYHLIIRNQWSRTGVKQSSIWDLSCVVTGVILALNLPAQINLFGAQSQAAIVFSSIFADLIGSAVAILIAKMLFGGIGRNFVNPAMLGRVFLFLCFGAAMGTVSSANGWGLDTVTGPTWLGSDKAASGGLVLDLFLGNTASAAVGEVCSVAILLGCIYLCITKVIDFRLPLIIMGSIGIFALLFDGLLTSKLSGEALLWNMLGHMLSGGILFAAVFMATDYATSPNTFVGTAIFGVGIALITMLIRVFGTYPEGTSFALLLMNLVTPLLDKWIVPKPFGHQKTAKQPKTDKAVAK